MGGLGKKRMAGLMLTSLLPLALVGYWLSQQPGVVERRLLDESYLGHLDSWAGDPEVAEELRWFASQEFFRERSARDKSMTEAYTIAQRATVALLRIGSDGDIWFVLDELDYGPPAYFVLTEPYVSQHTEAEEAVRFAIRNWDAGRKGATYGLPDWLQSHRGKTISPDTFREWASRVGFSGRYDRQGGDERLPSPMILGGLGRGQDVEDLLAGLESEDEDFQRWSVDFMMGLVSAGYREDSLKVQLEELTKDIGSPIFGPCKWALTIWDRDEGL